MKRLHLIIEGHVQGVWFRSNTQQVAGRLRLTGWVRNRADGAVEAVAEGPEQSLRELEAWCREGPPQARVERVDAKWEEATGELGGFEVRH